MRKLFCLALLLAASPLFAQSYTNIVATAITDAAGAVLASGSLCALATDGGDTPIPFGTGSSQALPLPVCRIVRDGGIITPLQLATPSGTNPQVQYRFTVTDSSTRRQQVYAHVNVTGTTWSFDAYPTGLSVPSVPVSYVQGPPGPACSIGSGLCNMTVPIVLPADPTSGLYAATKHYVDINTAIPLTQTATAPYTLSTSYNLASYMDGGLTTNMISTMTQGTTAMVTGVAGGLTIPVGSTTHQANGGGGFVINNSTFTNGVGGYFVGINNVSGGNTWGTNPLVSDQPGKPGQLWGDEIDVNINEATSHGQALAIVGGWFAQPTNMKAISIQKPIGPGNWGWNGGLILEAGALLGEGVGVWLNPYIDMTTANQSSQKIRFTATDVTSKLLQNALYEDQTSSFFIVNDTIGWSFGNQGQLAVMSPTAPTGQVLGVAVGKAKSTNDSATMSYVKAGADGSTANYVEFGTYGSGHYLTVDGLGNVAAPAALNVLGGSNVIYRCSAAGTLRAGQLTSVAGDCGTAVDTGLRTP